jgi:uncharacterized protein YukE
MGELYVDTAKMTGAVRNIDSATRQLGHLKGLLTSIHSRMRSAAPDLDDAGDKFDGFKDRWHEELGIIGNRLGRYKGAITNAATTYDKADREMANGIGRGASSPRRTPGV